MPGAPTAAQRQRLRRWCRGTYRVDVVALNDEFDWTGDPASLASAHDRVVGAE